MAIGERIRFMRNLRGMTQKWLGQAVGFPQKTADIRMAQYESGTRTPKEDLVKALANVLEVSPLALSVPDIDSNLGFIHTLFAIEDIHGVRAEKQGDEIHIVFDGSKRTTDASVFKMLSAMDLLTLDMLLEGQAAYQTALNGISDDELDTLYTINQMIAGYTTLNRSVDASNYGVRDLHMQFHLLIAKYADNRFLYKEIVSVRNIMRSLQSAAVYEDRNKHNYSDFVAPTHQKIICAIQNKDPDEARMMMQYEISQSREIYRTSHPDVNYSPE